MLPLIKIPFLEAPPIPPKNPRGTDITSAHGQDITKKINALYTHVISSCLNTNVGTRAKANANKHTIGV